MSSDLSAPRQGMHALRIPILDVAAVDTLGTLAGAYALARFMDWPFLPTAGALFVSSIYFHHLYHIDTKVMETIGLTK